MIRPPDQNVMKSSQSEPLFQRRYRVYWSETDAAGIMHFSNFFRVCERVEEEFLHSMGLWEKLYQHGILIPRVHASCDYEAPLRPGEEYTVAITELLVGKKSIEFHYVFTRMDGRVSARCRIVVAAYDPRLGRSVELPSDVRELLLRRGGKLKS